MKARTAIGILALVALVACSGGRGLRVLDNPGAGPDEFSVVPARPLELPPTTALPPPTPGGGNLADPRPLSDAAAVLGGSGAALSAGGVPAQDAALVAQAARNGRDPAIRQTLANEDLAFRSRAGVFRSLNPFGRDRYFGAYGRQALDAYAELNRFRELGIGVPSAPPETR